MNVKKSLKEKNRLVKEIQELYARLSQYNSVVWDLCILLPTLRMGACMWERNYLYSKLRDIKCTHKKTEKKYAKK